jgi:hypothetical protein
MIDAASLEINIRLSGLVLVPLLDRTEQSVGCPKDALRPPQAFVSDLIELLLSVIGQGWPNLMMTMRPVVIPPLGAQRRGVPKTFGLEGFDYFVLRAARETVNERLAVFAFGDMKTRRLIRVAGAGAHTRVRAAAKFADD